jgi:hypothetical protein
MTRVPLEGGRKARKEEDHVVMKAGKRFGHDLLMALKEEKTRTKEHG